MYVSTAVRVNCSGGKAVAAPEALDEPGAELAQDAAVDVDGGKYFDLQRPKVASDERWQLGGRWFYGEVVRSERFWYEFQPPFRAWSGGRINMRKASECALLFYR
jgi:hypothetical protein